MEFCNIYFNCVHCFHCSDGISQILFYPSSNVCVCVLFFWHGYLFVATTAVAIAYMFALLNFNCWLFLGKWQRTLKKCTSNIQRKKNMSAHSFIRHTQMLNQQIRHRCTCINAQERENKSEMNALCVKASQLATATTAIINMRLRSGSRHWINSIEPLNWNFFSVDILDKQQLNIQSRLCYEWDCAMIMMMARFTWLTHNVWIAVQFSIFNASYDSFH